MTRLAATLDVKMLRIVLVLLLLAGAAIAAPEAPAAPATAAPVRGVAWTGEVIRLYDTTPLAYREGIDIAIRSWNDARIGIRFVRTRRREFAHVTIRSKQFPGEIEGQASVGKVRGAGLWLDTALIALEPEMVGNRIVNPAGGAVPEHIAFVAAHELGHVLGLQHGSGCALMAPAGPQGCGYAIPDGMWTCRIQERVDVVRIARRYGGRPRTRTNPFCQFSATPAGAVGAVTTTKADRDVATKLDWKSVTNAFGFVIARSAAGGSCPAVPTDGQFYEQLDRSSYTQSYGHTTSMTVPATYCYAIWSKNGRGTLTGPTKVSITVEPPKVEPISNPTAAIGPALEIGRRIDLSWTQPAGTSGVRVFRMPGPASCVTTGLSHVAEAWNGATSTSDFFVEPGTWTWMVVRTDDPDAEEGSDSWTWRWVSEPRCVTMTI